jgi:hypothetical protein
MFEKPISPLLQRMIDDMTARRFESPRVCRRLFRLSHAAMAGSSICA